MQEYRKSRNHVTHTIKKAKRDYYYRKISSNPSSKKLWATLKNILPSKKSNYSIPRNLSSNDFNKYFSTIGQKVAASMSSENHKSFDQVFNIRNPSVSNDPNLFDSRLTPPQNYFQFLEISYDLVCKKILGLKLSSTLDILDIDTKLLKLSAYLISPSLTHVYNLSLCQGIVPMDLNVARVTPVFKNKGQPNDVSNYRPISVTSHFAKILEDVVKEQLVSFLTQYSLLSPNQFAYIKGRSTQLALHTMTDKWLQSIDSGEITGACFLDLSKCFDTVSHSILLEKLKTSGIMNTELKWFDSYLAGRTQVVRCNGSISKPCHLPIGVPQGTVLGSLLFILYANDLPDNLSTGTSIMYADDITLFYSAKSLQTVESCLQKCVNKTISWLKSNKLAVNPSKSNSMLIGTRQRIKKSTLNISINDCTVKFTNTFNLLGVIIDNNLSWKDHIIHISKKLSSKIGLIKRLYHILPRSVLLKLYEPLFQSNLDYCITVWGHAANKYINLLQRLQNRLARVVTNNFNRDISSSDICQDLGWMSVRQRHNFLVGCFMHKVINMSDLSHNYFNSCFTFIKDNHCHNTRLQCNNGLALPLPKTEYLKNSLSFKGTKIWNSIPANIKSHDNVNLFKTKYKVYICKQ